MCLLRVRIAKTLPKCIMSNQWHRSNFEDLFRFYGDHFKTAYEITADHDSF